MKITPRILLFPVHFGRLIDLKTHFVINNTGSKPMSFMIISNVPQFHTVYPAYGYIQPNSVVAIRVKLYGKFVAEYCRHQLLVRTTAVDPEIIKQKKSALTVWRETKSTKQIPSTYYTVRCDWSLAAGETEVVLPEQEDEAMDVQQAEQKRRTVSSSLNLLSTVSVNDDAAIKAERDRLIQELQEMKAVLAKHEARESEKDIELNELKKKAAADAERAKLAIAEAQAAAEAAMNSKSGHSGRRGKKATGTSRTVMDDTFDASDLWDDEFDGLDDDLDDDEDGGSLLGGFGRRRRR